MKVASTVRRGADGKGTQVTSPAAYPTKPAILANAAALICGHNHPSGDPQPSQEDRVLTQRLAEAGKLLGISVLDHLIVGDGTQDHFSFADTNAL
jgi:DNA repair protein RadC